MADPLLENLLQDLERRLSSIEGLVESRSRFSDRPAWWSDGREIAHFDRDGVVDIRLTAVAIRARRSELAAHPEITFRPSSGADWLEIDVSDPDAGRLAVSLVRDAVRANRRDTPSKGRARKVRKNRS